MVDLIDDALVDRVLWRIVVIIDMFFEFVPNDTKLIFGYLYGVFCLYPFDQWIPIFGLEIPDFIGATITHQIYLNYIFAAAPLII